MTDDAKDMLDALVKGGCVINEHTRKAYRLGVEQERARCGRIVRDQLQFIVHSNIYNRIAEIIERGE